MYIYYVCLEDVLRVVRVASVTDIDKNVYVCLEDVLDVRFCYGK